MNERTEKSPEMSEPTVGDARTAPLLALWGVVGLVAGLFLALFGAFGTYEYSLALRLALWVPIGLFAACIALVLEWGFAKTSMARAPMALRWPVFIAVYALVITPIAYATNRVLGSPSLADIVMYFQNSIVLSGLYCGGRLIVARLLETGLGVTDAAVVPGPARDAPRVNVASDTFRARMPRRLRNSQLLAVSSEGHYVRVHTDQGSDLILLRLKDAISELADLDGRQVHRSWWVLRPAIEKAEREDGRWQLILHNGVEVPVSRKRVAALKEVGWLKRAD